MKKPIKPLKSGKYICQPKSDPKVLISKFYVHPDRMEGFKERHLSDNEQKKSPQIEEWWYDTNFCSLKDILDVTPPDADPSKILISINRDRQVEYINVSIDHHTSLDKEAWLKAKDEEEADYCEKLKQYHIDYLAYKTWKTKQDIKKLKDQLKTIEDLDGSDSEKLKGFYWSLYDD